jgi:hypothetical protein
MFSVHVQDELCASGGDLESSQGCVDWYRLRCGLKANRDECAKKLAEEDMEMYKSWI